MKRTICLLALSLALSLTTARAGGAFAHKYHTSVTRVEYNRAERYAEITIQTFTDDLQDILQKRTGAAVRLDAGKKTDRLVFDYLQSAFELKNSAAVRSPLEWVGMEVKGETVWLYVQAKMTEGVSKATLRNALLFDLFDDQVNIVNILEGGRKSSLVFKHGDGPREIP